jgi:hypothetical protein
MSEGINNKESSELSYHAHYRGTQSPHAKS